MYLRESAYMKGKPDSIKAQHHNYRRVGWQESAAQNNFRRVIAAAILPGQFCNHKINYIPECNSSISLELLLCLLNSKLSDWMFRLQSASAAVSHYQVLNLPAPTFVKAEGETPQASHVNGNWIEVAERIGSKLPGNGLMADDGARFLEDCSSRIQEIERKRDLRARSERSELANESQIIQDAVDRIIFRCFGFSGSDGGYIELRLKEML